MTERLEKERERRKKWVASILGEPVENVTLSDYAEPVEPEPWKCGAGRGAECCIFLTVSGEGFCCERGGEMDIMLRNRKKTMNARREPEEPWPECMIFEGKPGEADD